MKGLDFSAVAPASSEPNGKDAENEDGGGSESGEEDGSNEVESEDEEDDKEENDEVGDNPEEEDEEDEDNGETTHVIPVANGQMSKATVPSKKKVSKIVNPASPGHDPQSGSGTVSYRAVIRWP